MDTKATKMVSAPVFQGEHEAFVLAEDVGHEVRSHAVRVDRPLATDEDEDGRFRGAVLHPQGGHDYVCTALVVAMVVVMVVLMVGRGRRTQWSRLT